MSMLQYWWHKNCVNNQIKFRKCLLSKTNPNRGLLGCDTMYYCRWIPAFQRNMLLSFFRVKVNVVGIEVLHASCVDQAPPSLPLQWIWVTQTSATCLYHLTTSSLQSLQSQRRQYSCEILVSTYNTAWCHNPGHNLNTFCHKNLCPPRNTREMWYLALRAKYKHYEKFGTKAHRKISGPKPDEVSSQCRYHIMKSSLTCRGYLVSLKHWNLAGPDEQGRLHISGRWEIEFKKDSLIHHLLSLHLNY